MRHKSGVYEILNKTNGKRYVGSATSLRQRKRDHWSRLRGRDHHNRYLQNAWNKYGESAFTFNVLHTLYPENNIAIEQGEIDLGAEYNICKVAGSSLGLKASAETKARISAANKGYKHTAETKAKIAASKIGRKRPPVTAETRAKLSAAHKGNKRRLGKKHTAETRAKISAALRGNLENVGRMHTPEARANMSAAQKGKTFTAETRAKLSAAKQRLTPAQVHDIRHLLALGDMSLREIAKYYPVSGSTVGRINRGEAYN